MRFLASWWVLPADKAPREPLAEGLVNWWVCATRTDAGARGVTWKMITAVVDAESKPAAVAIVEAHWSPTQWHELVPRPAAWMPHTARFPSKGHEMRVRGRK